jgi:ubiquitin carboxyl-terminal hydrolase L5
MLNADLALKYEVDKWNQDKKKKKRKSGGKRSKKAEYQDEAAFHFIAYVPIDGEVWRLDGLQRQPINLGKPTIFYNL